MRKLSHKRAINQQSLDMFFKPPKEKVTTKDIQNDIKPISQKSNIQNCFLDVTPEPEKNKTYEPIITLSDFELGFDTDEEESQEFETTNKMRKNTKTAMNDLDSDNDSDFEKDDISDEDNFYDESQISSPTIVTRHQELEKKKEKINIFTPEWSYTNSRDVPEEKLLQKIKYDLNSLCNIHYQLEVIEKRIQNGDDEEHEHPAMCVQVLVEEGLSEVTDEEKKLRSDYVEIEYEKIKPSFWEPRCYDDEYYQLTRNDNKNLQSCIYLANDTDSDDIVRWKPEDALIPPSNDIIPNRNHNDSKKKSDKKVKDNSIFNSKNSTEPYSPKFVFVNSSTKKVPQISFVYKGESKNSKKNPKHTEPKKILKREKIENPIKDEKKEPSKARKINTLFAYIAKDNQKVKETNPFAESDDYSSDSDSTITDNESDLDSYSDSDVKEENKNDVIASHPNAAESFQVENPVFKEKPIISKQKLLRLSSLLFDTDSTDCETDLENF